MTHEVQDGFCIHCDCHDYDTHNHNCTPEREALATQPYTDRIAALEAEVKQLREAMPELTKRRCRDCGNIAYHSEPVTPYVLCRKCGSQDTSKTLLDFPQEQPHAN